MSSIRTFEVLIDLARAERPGPGGGAARLPSLASATARPRSSIRPRRRRCCESTRASIPQLQTELQQARNALSTLLGQPTGHDRRVAGRAQGDSQGAREGGRRRAGRDAAAASGHPQRRAPGRRAVRPHRRRQGRSLSELLAPRHGRPSGQHRADGLPQSLHRQRPLLFRRAPDQLAVPQLRPARRTACASRTRGFSSCWSATATPCSRRPRRWRTR